MRRLAIFSARKAACSSPSPWPMPSKTTRPFPISEMTFLSTVTLAFDTRCTNARISLVCQHPLLLFERITSDLVESFLLGGCHSLIFDSQGIASKHRAIFFQNHPIKNIFWRHFNQTIG